VLGVGSLPEEVFKVCLRDDCLTVRMLRRRALKNFIKLAASAEFSKLVDVADMTVKRIGYVITEESRIAAVRKAVYRNFAVLSSYACRSEGICRSPQARTAPRIC
jgi:hypothetical protein